MDLIKLIIQKNAEIMNLHEVNKDLTQQIHKLEEQVIALTEEIKARGLD